MQLIALNPFFKTKITKRKIRPTNRSTQTNDPTKPSHQSWRLSVERLRFVHQAHNELERRHTLAFADIRFYSIRDKLGARAIQHTD